MLDSCGIPFVLGLGLLGKILVGLAIVYLLVVLGMIGKYLMLWRTAKRAGAGLSLTDILAMRRRKVNPREVIGAFREAVEFRLELSVQQIEQHHSHGGRVYGVIEAMALAKSNEVRVSWADLCRRDLAGQDVASYVNNRIEERRKLRKEVKKGRRREKR